MRRLLVIALVVPAAFACAQRSPTGNTSRTLLAMMPDVKKELKITKDQDKKILDAVKAMGQGAEAGNIMIDMSDPMGSMDVDMGPILNDVQKARLEELFVQANLGWALTDAKVAAALALTDEQKEQAKSQKATASRELLQAMSQARSASAMKEAQKKRDEYAVKFLDILTAEQKAKFETMKGKAFKFKM